MSSVLSSFDYRLILSATKWTNQSDAHYLLVYFIAEVLVLLFPFVLFYLWRRPDISSKHHGNQKAVVLASMAVVVALAVKTVAAFFLVRDRPFVQYPDLVAITHRVDAQSFPSAHTLIVFTIAVSLYLSGFKRLGWGLGICAVLVGVGRVFAGVHYPSDVLGGALLGSFTAWYLHREASGLKQYLPNHY